MGSAANLVWYRCKDKQDNKENRWLLGPEEARPSRTVELHLHTVSQWPVSSPTDEIKYVAIGWTIKLGVGNPLREIGLPEALALTPTESDRYEVVGEMVAAHLDLIDAAETRLGKFKADHTTTRAAVDSASRLLRDIVRLRREAYIAREATTPDVETEMNRRLAG